MNDQETETTSTLSTTDLIENIYKIAVKPHSYDDFMDKWGSYISDSIDQLQELEKQVALDSSLETEALTPHFEMGLRLLEELGGQDPNKKTDQTRALNAAASILVDHSGRIVWYNGAANRLFGLQRISAISDIDLWSHSRDELDKILKLISNSSEVTTQNILLRANNKTTDKSIFLIPKIVPNGDEERFVRLDQVITAWREPVTQMLIDSFEISNAEAQIAELLATGASINEISEQRSSSVNTVRTQVKTLLGKLGVRSQTELVRLLASLNTAVVGHEQQNRHVQRGETFRFLQRDGRSVPYHRFGPPNGRPCIFIHGMLAGCGLPDAFIEQLQQREITVYAPERPFYGSAAGPTKGDIRNAPHKFAQDVEDLMDHLEIESAAVVGHMGGSIYSFAVAAHIPQRIKGILNLAGGVPVVEKEQISSMAPRQRVVAYTAKYTPKLLPFVIRAGIRQIDAGGEDAFLQALYDRPGPDRDEIERHDVAQILASGHRFTVSQGHRAFEIDSYHVVRDWSDVALKSSVPVTLLHGRHDPVVDCVAVEKFAERSGPGTTLEVLENCGQLIIFTAPEIAARALDQIV